MPASRHIDLISTSVPWVYLCIRLANAFDALLVLSFDDMSFERDILRVFGRGVPFVV